MYSTVFASTSTVSVSLGSLVPSMYDLEVLMGTPAYGIIQHDGRRDDRSMTLLQPPLFPHPHNP